MYEEAWNNYVQDIDYRQRVPHHVFSVVMIQVLCTMGVSNFQKKVLQSADRRLSNVTLCCDGSTLNRYEQIGGC